MMAAAGKPLTTFEQRSAAARRSLDSFESDDIAALRGTGFAGFISEGPPGRKTPVIKAVFLPCRDCPPVPCCHLSLWFICPCGAVHSAGLRPGYLRGNVYCTWLVLNNGYKLEQLRPLRKFQAAGQ